MGCLLFFEDADIDLPLQQNIGLEMFYFCTANTLIPRDVQCAADYGCLRAGIKQHYWNWIWT